MLKSVLIIDPDKAVRDLVATSLEPSSNSVLTATNLCDARELILSQKHALVILEPSLPDGDGLELLDILHSGIRSAPTIVTSADGGVIAQVDAYSRGARDYVVKPYDPDVLLCKMTVWLDDTHVPDTVPLVLDADTRQLSNGDVGVRLAPVHARLLQALAERPGQKQRRTDLLRVWRERLPQPRTIDIYICELRNALASLGAAHAILTLRGGYVWRGALDVTHNAGAEK